MYPEAVPFRFRPLNLALALMFTAAMVTAAVATPAIAATPAMVSVSVPYKDLDLSRTAGRTALDLRVLRAARRACGDDPSTVALKQGNAVRQCIRHSIADAAPRVDRIVARHGRLAGLRVAAAAGEPR